MISWKHWDLNGSVEVWLQTYKSVYLVNGKFALLRLCKGRIEKLGCTVLKHTPHSYWWFSENAICIILPCSQPQSPERKTTREISASMQQDWAYTPQCYSRWWGRRNILTPSVRSDECDPLPASQLEDSWSARKICVISVCPFAWYVLAAVVDYGHISNSQIDQWYSHCVCMSKLFRWSTMMRTKDVLYCWNRRQSSKISNIPLLWLKSTFGNPPPSWTQAVCSRLPFCRNSRWSAIRSSEQQRDLSLCQTGMGRKLLYEARRMYDRQKLTSRAVTRPTYMAIFKRCILLAFLPS